MDYVQANCAIGNFLLDHNSGQMSAHEILSGYTESNRGRSRNFKQAQNHRRAKDSPVSVTKSHFKTRKRDASDHESPSFGASVAKRRDEQT